MSMNTNQFRLGTVASGLKNQPIWIVLVAIFAIFSVSAPGFLRPINLSNVLLHSSITGIVALGMTCLMLTGNFDLSVGSVMALAAVIVISLQASIGIPLAIAAAVLVGAIIGLLNGVLVSVVGINGFVVTLGAMIGLRGVVYFLTGEHPIIGRNIDFSRLGNSRVGIVPINFLVFLALLIVLHIVLTKTIHGRNTYAIGGNEEAARNAGIPVARHITLNFMITSATAAIAGVVMASRLNTATPNLGLRYELLVISIVVLSGTKLRGGYGGVIRTFGGVLVIGIIQNGLDLLGVQIYYQILVMGLLLILAMILDRVFDPIAHLKPKKQGG
jgi:ribose transport system permease protein